MLKKISCRLHNEKQDFFSFFRFMICWQKSVQTNFRVLFSDWLEFLIHIHRARRVFAHFKLFVDE